MTRSMVIFLFTNESFHKTGHHINDWRRRRRRRLRRRERATSPRRQRTLERRFTVTARALVRNRRRPPPSIFPAERRSPFWETAFPSHYADGNLLCAGAGLFSPASKRGRLKMGDIGFPLSVSVSKRERYGRRREREREKIDSACEKSSGENVQIPPWGLSGSASSTSLSSWGCCSLRRKVSKVKCDQMVKLKVAQFPQK